MDLSKLSVEELALLQKSLENSTPDEINNVAVAFGLTSQDTISNLTAAEQVDRLLAEQSYLEFIRQAWHLVEPSVEFHENWHVTAMCRHIEELVFGDKIKNLLCNVPPGSMKPVHVDEPVLTSKGYRRLGDIEVGDRVLTHTGKFQSVTAAHEQGRLPILKVTTQSGRTARTAPDHPFLTVRGWVQAKDLVVGDYLAIPHVQEDLEGEAISAEEARLLGYLVGDGCISQRSLSFVNADQDVVDDFIHCAEMMGFYAKATRHSSEKVKATKVILKSTEGMWKSSDGEPSVLSWLKYHGLYRSNSYTKKIPEAVFGSDVAISNFVGAYWSCDGMVTERHKNKKTTILVSATAVSKQLAYDLQRALTCINIHMRVRRKVRDLSTKSQGEEYVSYDIVTSRRNEAAKFKNIPFLCERKRGVLEPAFRDQFDNPLTEDEITSVQSVDSGECRCLTVAEDSSFTINGLVVHNSLCFSVFLVPWTWTRDPSKRFMCCSYDQKLSGRDSIASRKIIQSDWYKTRWGHKFELDKDEANQTRYANSSKGWRFATSVGGTATGFHPDIIILDDPHKVKEMESEADREAVVNFWSGTIATRGMTRDVRKAIVGQRVHFGDLSAHICEQNGGDAIVIKDTTEWNHFRIPMRFEGPEGMPKTNLGFKDPRSEPGELLWPVLYPEEKVAQLERDLASVGPDVPAGQLQQRPTRRGGSIVKRSWFEIVDTPPSDIIARCRHWDKAATLSGGAYSCGIRVSRDTKGSFYIEDVVRGQVDPTGRHDMMLQAASLDYTFDARTTQSIEEEGGSAGKDAAWFEVNLLAGYPVQTTRPTGSKETRFAPFASQAKAGNVKIVRGEWNEALLAELEQFPLGKYKDQVDACSGAVNFLIRGNRLALPPMLMHGSRNEAPLTNEEKAEMPEYLRDIMEGAQRGYGDWDQA